jgi:ABC-type bacteriocin/lantibiotic exporter with double-glycine peptidase domain
MKASTDSAAARGMILLALCALAACGAARLPSPSAHLVTGVPFYPQAPQQCGPAVLASMLGFFGHPVTPESLAVEIYDPAKSGTSTVTMLSYGARHGLPIEALRGDLRRIRAEIDAGRPVIVLLQEGWLFRGYHFVLLTGYDPGGGVVYGYSGRNAKASWEAEEFTRRWAAADNWTLVWTGDREDARTPPNRRAGEQDQADAGKGE